MNGQFSHLYPIVMLVSVGCGAILSRRYKAQLGLLPSHKLWIGLFAFCGAMMAAKIPFLIPGLPGFNGTSGILLSGKTILFGLVGGYAGVEFAKWTAGIHTKTGDAFVVPVAVSVGIGRIACFCGGCCYGTPTSLPWGIRFLHVDNQPRHPTQLYESIFHFSMAAICAILYEQKIFPKQLIKFYFISYFAYRFLTEFIRPEQKLALGLTVYQWTAVFLIGIFAFLWYRDSATSTNRNLIRRDRHSCETL